MAIGAGLASQLGFKKETTYGTRVAPTAFYEYNSESVQLDRRRIMSRALRAGRTFQSSTRVASTTRSGAGSVTMEVVTKEFGRWLDMLHGNTVTPTQVGGTTAYLQTHNIGTSDPNKSATVQVGKPGEAGTVHPFDYLGAMVTGYTFSCSVDDFLTASFDLDVQDRVTNQTLATASYPSALVSYDFHMATVSVNGSGVADTFDSFTLAGQLPRNVARYRLGSGQIKLQPITNDYTAATVTLGGAFKNLTNLALYDADTIFPVVVTFDSGVAAGAGNNYLIRFTMQNCQITGQDPVVGGPDTLSQDLAMNVLDDGTNPPVKIEYQEIATAAL